MSKFSFMVYLNAYGDIHPSNNAAQNNFKWNRDLTGLLVSNPTSQTATLAPGETRSFFSGIRTLAQDGTTQYSISLVPLSSNTYQLSAVAGTLPNFRTPRSLSTNATTAITVSLNGPVATFSGPAIGLTNAFFTGTIGGLSTSVTITANNAGTAGNSIVIIPDGTSSVSTLITNWNTTNPLQAVTLTSGDGTQIPTGGSFTFSGGTNTTALNTGGVAVGDYVFVGNVFNLLNQGPWQIISVGTNSVSVDNPGGVNEGPLSLGSGYATQFQVYSAAGVQINDTLVISGGFSPVTQGSYKVTAVLANSLQFYTPELLPQESNIQTTAISLYSEAKSFVYIEADSATNVIINGSAAGTINPFIMSGLLGATTRPGVYMLSSTVYSLSLQNNGVNPSSVFFAAVE